MNINLCGRSLLSLFDYSAEEIQALLDFAISLKQKKQRGEKGNGLVGKKYSVNFQ